MAIANFGDLKTAIADWLNRSDLTSYVPTFIDGCSTRIYYGSEDPVLPSKPVRVWAMQTVETPTLSGNAFDLPARYISTILLQGDQGSAGNALRYATPSQFAQYNANSGAAQFFTILNNQVKLSGTGPQTLTHHYYQKFAAFSADGDTNALLTAAPFLYLYGSLMEAYIFVADDENTKKFHRLYNAVVGGLNKNADEHGGGTLAVRAG